MNIKTTVEAKLKERVQNGIKEELELLREEYLGSLSEAASRKDTKLIKKLTNLISDLDDYEVTVSLSSHARLDRMKDIKEVEFNDSNTSDRFTNTKLVSIEFGDTTIDLGEPKLWVQGFKEFMQKLYEVNPSKYVELAKNSGYTYISDNIESLKQICEDRYIDGFNGLYWNNKSNTIYKVKMMYDLIKQYGYNTINFKVVA